MRLEASLACRSLDGPAPLLVVLMAIGVAGCNLGGVATSGPLGDTTDLEKAVASWQATKPRCPSYHYDRQLPDPMGRTSITTVQIVDDVPVLRWFLATFSTPGEEWQEGAGNIGTHPDGYPAETVEQLHDECRQLILYGWDGGVPLAGGHDLLTQFDDRGVPLMCLSSSRANTTVPLTGIQLDGFSCAVLDVGHLDGGTGD
jgi:hypothetical protein